MIWSSGAYELDDDAGRVDVDAVWDFLSRSTAVPEPASAGSLHTTDAHGLCRHFGFAAPHDRYLERPSQT